MCIRDRLTNDLGAAWPGDAAILCRRIDAQGRAPRAAPTEVLEDDAAGYARGLFAALYRLERANPRQLLIAQLPDDDAFAAVRDRIARAAQRA